MDGERVLYRYLPQVLREHPVDVAQYVVEVQERREVESAQRVEVPAALEEKGVDSSCTCTSWSV